MQFVYVIGPCTCVSELTKKVFLLQIKEKFIQTLMSIYTIMHYWNSQVFEDTNSIEVMQTQFVYFLKVNISGTIIILGLLIAVKTSIKLKGD